MPTISNLFCYPVKSLGGIPLVESKIEPRGLEFDRRWMIVDADGTFLSQRSDPRLALFRTSIEADGIRLTNPIGEERIAPFQPQGGSRFVRIWKDSCEAVQVSAEIDMWLSEGLNLACSLVHMPDNTLRATNQQFTLPGDIVGFADAFPILAIGEASLEDLNSRVEMTLSLNRFRPNIAVEGWEPYQEDDLTELRIGNVTLRAAKACGRCSVTSTNQETGEVGVEPLRTLAKYRLKGQVVYFGAYFVPVSTGTIRIGDVVDFR